MSEKDNLSNRFKINKKKDINAPEETKTLKFSEDIVKTALNKNNETCEEEVNIYDIQDEFKIALFKKIEATPIWFEYTKDKQIELVKNFVNNKIIKDKIIISDIDKDIIIDKLLETINGFGEIQYLLDNQKVSSVEINGTNSVFIEIDGKHLNTEIKLSIEQLNYILKYISFITGDTDFSNINNFQTEKYCITIVGERISSSGININIKKQPNTDISALIEKGIISDNVLKFISSAIEERKNIIISGATNTYKTTFITSFIKNIDANKRIFILEETNQINIQQENLSIFTLAKTPEKYKEISSYIQKSEPDYIITDLNTIKSDFSQMQGKIATIKANNVEDCLKFLISSYTQDGILEKFAKTMALTEYDYIIQLSKDENNSVKISSIIELSPQKTMALSAKPILKTIVNKNKKKLNTPKKSLGE